MKEKHDADYNEAMDRAEEDFRKADGQEMVEKCPYLFSSNKADAYWITAYSLYWTGRLPKALHKSRGNTWLVDYPGQGVVKAEVIKADQRSGICFLEPRNNLK